MTAVVKRQAARWLPELAVIAALLVLPFGFVAATGSVDLMTRILIWGLLGFGLDLLFGYTGLLSFGQAAFYGTGGFVAAYLLTSGVLSSIWLALLLAVLIAMGYGAVVGYLALRRVGIYFAMITLAFGELSYFLENSPLADWTGGENGLPGVPTPVFHLGGFTLDLSGSWGLYGFTAGFYLLGYVLARFVVLSPFGSVLTAIRDNPARAAALGHHVQGYKLSTFVIAAGYSGLAGALLGIFQSYMPPDAFSLDTSGQLVIQTVIGGAGTLLGPTVGAAIWLYLRDALQQIPAIGDLWKFVLGLIFVILVTVLRKGVTGEVKTAWLRFRRGTPASEAPPAAAAAPKPARRPAPAPQSAPRPAAANGLALEAQGLCKFYDGVHAVEDVSFALPQGMLYAIIGPNGAGKSTFLRLLSGEIPPTTGSVLLNGIDVTGESITAMCHHGLAKSNQINQLFPQLTVRQNLRVAAFGRHRGRLRFDLFCAAESIPEVEAKVVALMEETGLTERADLLVGTLAYGEKRRLELGLALASDPTVLLLDEPLAGLSPAERQDITALIKQLHERLTIVLVEHDMDAVFALAERIMVLHDGHKLADGTLGQIQADRSVQQAYLGGVGPR